MPEFYLTYSMVLRAFQTPVASNIAKDDEAAAMAAMFQAQTQNWEETQEKMSQLVNPSGFIYCIVVFYLMNTIYFSICVSFSAQVIHRNPRGTGFGGRGGKPPMPINDRPLPPSYVCYRCGQKGLHLLFHRKFECLQFDSRPLDPGLPNE